MFVVCDRSGVVLFFFISQISCLGLLIKCMAGDEEEFQMYPIEGIWVNVAHFYILNTMNNTTNNSVKSIEELIVFALLLESLQLLKVACQCADWDYYQIYAKAENISECKKKKDPVCLLALSALLISICILMKIYTVLSLYRGKRVRC